MTVVKLHNLTAKAHYQRIQLASAFDFALPYGQALPSVFPECGNISLVPVDIALQLVPPERDIAFRHNGIPAP